ncbi:flagellar biosynthesis anti-sigma factor FlgM [Rahnella sp. PD12R]|uniref:flagellar biosynthesis anti-sigma factor FlgM n=1 Tax=Rahnella sp. PD12R TaxID=2855688 RepID=UPI001C43FE8C|nr:flagellar biosynthesis anti-sigma factor FlgM [Rahnella sp. PD12R]MBV6820074.1 flagellar biosynthesis anti-sigma factor FlgM [Rahnella sp. PD12R]
MKINATQHTAATAPLQTTKETRNEAATSGKKAAQPQNVPETRDSMMINDAKTQLHAMPDVDMERVSALKAAISQGKLQVNCDELAQSMRDFFRS